MGLTTAGRVDDGSGSWGGGDVHPPLSEYWHPVYCYSDDIRAMSGGGATEGRIVDDEMVGSGRPQLRPGGDGDRGGWVGGKGGHHREGGRGEVGNGRVGWNRYGN